MFTGIVCLCAFCWVILIFYQHRFILYTFIDIKDEKKINCSNFDVEGVDLDQPFSNQNYDKKYVGHKLCRLFLYLKHDCLM